MVNLATNICAFCSKAFTCGCQKTKDRNGNTVHKGCLDMANAQIRVTQLEGLSNLDKVRNFILEKKESYKYNSRGFNKE